jgi:hypothetical protein
LHGHGICSRAESTAAFSAAKVVCGVLFIIFVSTHPTTRMLLMVEFTARVPVLGHAANARFALASANPAAPAAVILRKSRRCFCMNRSFSLRRERKNCRHIIRFAGCRSRFSEVLFAAPQAP